MSNLGQDPSEYLPPDYSNQAQNNQQPQPQFDNPAFDARNQYDQQDAADAMNGPTGVDMYERRSPNAFAFRHVSDVTSGRVLLCNPFS